MSENLKALDEFPTFTGEESPQEQIRQLQNYLYVVKEQLRYALSNLSEKNLNPTAWAAMQKQTIGSLVANDIVAGIFKSKDGETFYLDLDKGILRMQATEFSMKGKKLDEIVQEEVSAFSDAVTGQLANLQSQIDGNITTWFGSNVPTESNEPASNWTTAELKNQHLGDLFYIVDNAEQGGFVYRWAMVNGAYSWQIVEDVEVAKALEQAAKAQDTADGKRRVFVAQPAPPYDVGDLWTDGANLRVCKVARGTGAYAASDWTLATNYIAKEDLSHEDIFKKLFKDGEVQGVEIYENRLYINGEYAVIKNIAAESITSGTLYGIIVKAGRIESKDGKIIIDLSGTENVPVFNTGIATNGLVVRGDQVGAQDVMRAEAVKSESGHTYFRTDIYSVTGKQIGYLVETFTTEWEHSGVTFELESQLSGERVQMAAGSASHFAVADKEGYVKAVIGTQLQSGKGMVQTDILSISGNGNCKWEYIESIGKTVLVQV